MFVWGWLCDDVLQGRP